MGNRSSNGTPSGGTADYDYKLTNSHPEDTNLAYKLNIDPPKEQERHDSAKMGTYFHITNMCWIVVFLVLVFLLLLVGFIVDAETNTTQNWSASGSRRFNDRYVSVSSIHKKNFDFAQPSRYLLTANSTTATPSIWDGIVIFPTMDGKIIAITEVTGEVVWALSICEDIYGLNTLFCEEQTHIHGRYMSRSTPTIWAQNVVISINGPADIIVLDRHHGTWVSTIPLSLNPYAVVTQAGSVWDNQLYVGTSSNITNSGFYERNTNGGTGGVNCTYVGTFYRVNLNTRTIVWATSMVNPDGVVTGDYLGFGGIPISGSSPPLSIRKGLVMFNTGNLTCWPASFQACVDASTYATVHQDCYENPLFKYALFNSLVVLKMDTGGLFFHEKFYGYRTWDISCNHQQPSSSSCSGGACPFNNDRYVNCPSQANGRLDSFEFAGDPILGADGRGEEIAYVAQNSGLVVAIELKADDAVVVPNGRIQWATQVLNGSGIGGIAADNDRIYFSVYNINETLWYVNATTTATGQPGVLFGNTTCGGWGALYKTTGLPSWYTEHPKCDSQAFIYGVQQAGSYGPPTVTNDLLLVTSGDVLVDVHGEPVYIPTQPYSITRSGHVYSLCVDTGAITSELDTGAPFFQQGISVKQRCVYAGNGYMRDTSDDGKFFEGNSFFIWCVKNTHSNGGKKCPSF